MSFKVENMEEKNMVKLVIEATAEEFEAGLNTAFNKNKNKISVPGFRKGKAPRKMVEKLYGTEIFYEDAANAIIPDAYAKAADESELEIVSQPKINVVQIEAGKPFIFEAVVAVKPEVELGQYKGVEVEKCDTEVTDADVEAEVEKMAAAYGMEVETGQVTDIEEISGHGVKADIGGKEVLAGNLKLMNKYNIDSSAGKDSIENALGTLVYVAIGGIYAGCIVISDVIKPTSQQAIAALKKAGVKKVIMLTGDAKKVAELVAGKLGVDEVKSELLPADKVIEVEKLLNSKGKDEMLAFVGDGINDAPVLSRADIGIAMGALGSDAAIEAADIVLMDDDPAKIATAMNISRKTLRIVHQNIVFALAIKIACLALGAAGVANMWMAIFADVGVMILAVLNAIRTLFVKNL